MLCAGRRIPAMSKPCELTAAPRVIRGAGQPPIQMPTLPTGFEVSRSRPGLVNRRGRRSTLRDLERTLRTRARASACADIGKEDGKEDSAPEGAGPKSALDWMNIPFHRRVHDAIESNPEARRLAPRWRRPLSTPKMRGWMGLPCFTAGWDAKEPARLYPNFPQAMRDNSVCYRTS